MKTANTIFYEILSLLYNILVLLFLLFALGWEKNFINDCIFYFILIISIVFSIRFENYVDRLIEQEQFNE